MPTVRTVYKIDHPLTFTLTIDDPALNYNIPKQITKHKLSQAKASKVNKRNSSVAVISSEGFKSSTRK